MTDQSSVAAADRAVVSQEESHEPCRNCGTVLRGPHCHRCGQAAREMVRSFPLVVRDFLDTVFEYDGRLWRTLVPLMVRPGHLSVEFLQGRRVRYVNPFRLFFFLTVIAFFAAQFRFDVAVGDADGVGVSLTSEIASAATVEEVERKRAEALAELDSAVDTTVVGPGAVAIRAGLNAARTAIHADADRRISQLNAAGEEGDAPPAPLPPTRISIDGGAWDPVINPVHLEWLPPGVNARLNDWLARADVNQRRIRENPNLLKDAFLSSVPATLFVVVPIFALLLKLAYLFRRRLYMEHLIVAFHSHAFFSATLLLVILLSAVSAWVGDLPIARPLTWIERLLILWMPIYVLLMQKRVYGQGWPLTLIKAWVLGVCYALLLSFAVTVNLLFNLVVL
jgi:hypothetical protein